MPVLHHTVFLSSPTCCLSIPLLSTTCWLSFLLQPHMSVLHLASFLSPPMCRLSISLLSTYVPAFLLVTPSICQFSTSLIPATCNMQVVFSASLRERAPQHYLQQKVYACVSRAQADDIQESGYFGELWKTVLHRDIYSYHIFINCICVKQFKKF